ncbi:hypothetical protein CMI47_00585 [Candidatus Pacearchaeota archaeon]|nr:hypothetical protein [Candidatus Pacearchaeota archaeon]|tara:strand:+ start:1155 stop:1538 length:384 start_codon:yes stop_codon:yes gene_type:complete
MAITLYDRSDAGDSMLSEDGGRLLHSAVIAIRCFLAEAEADGPIDLRDLQSIIHSATDDVILNAIITRRLSVRRKRPRPGGGSHRSALGWNKGWDCESSPTEYCSYDDDKDPMHDECSWCGQPEERK